MPPGANSSRHLKWRQIPRHVIHRVRLAASLLGNRASVDAEWCESVCLAPPGDPSFNIQKALLLPNNLHLHSPLFYHSPSSTTTLIIGTNSPAMSNSTLLASPDTYFGIYNELSKYNVHLNVFERLWAVSFSLIGLVVYRNANHDDHRVGMPT